MTGISKSFGGVQALAHVDFGVRYGEVHALLGENGAGKSTLLKILRGVLPADSGQIEIGGEALPVSDADAVRRAGVAMIFQEMSLIPTLSVAQNIFLNREPKSRLGFVDDERIIRETRKLFEEFGVTIDPEAPLTELSAGQRQLTEIVKALSERSRILILDEPTSALSNTEVDRLFVLLRRLRSDGVAIIYVSHRMDEIMRIADRATIMRDGRRALTAPLSELSLATIIEHIIGRASRGLGEVDRDGEPHAEALIELRNASGARKPRNVDLVIRQGEVLGAAGLLGSGRSSLARLLFGMEPLAAGEIRVKGVKANIRSPREAIAAGIALIPEERLLEGVIAQHSVGANIVLPVLERVSRHSWVSDAAAAEVTREQIAQLRIKTASAGAAVNTLSGGNQQKVVVGKWLAATPAILVLDEPTAGIDIGAKSEIVRLVRQLARAGRAILLISSEMPVLLAACDRIVVMSEGRIVKNIARHELDPAPDAGADEGERLRYAERELLMAIQTGAAMAA
ncbi:MAG TPA: sugar ABC transporter ATP-binding protein [Roseiarcus sp.]|nr:sugar ABC transporter ATP-binding protein [Roseiarcus sp.]